jgi:tRNA(fMet)-specific endonuclease VapC
VGYLLDTNIVSDMMRSEQGKAERRALQIGPENVLTSILVVAEIRFGLAKRPSPALELRLQQLSKAIPVLDFKPPADAAYAVIRRQLEQSGKPIGAMDMLIAAQALAGDHTLVTANEREFARVPGLRVENWLR